MDNLLGSRLTMKTKYLGLSLRDFLDWVDWWEKTYLCGQHHPIDWSPGLQKKEKPSRTFLCFLTMTI